MSHNFVYFSCEQQSSPDELKRSSRSQTELVEAHRPGDDLPLIPKVAVEREAARDPVTPRETALHQNPWELASAEEISSGLVQLNRYLSRSWYRAGIPPQQHGDCTQVVHLILLENLGRPGFDRLASDLGESGLRTVLGRDVFARRAFFRAVDAVKKRAVRQRVFQPLDCDVACDANRGPAWGWRETLEEAMSATLAPLEAALVQHTLQGETPAAIALRWGVAPKTVSNQKTRVLKKLRAFLAPSLSP